MTKEYHIRLTGSFNDTGFGFSCMKKAYELQIIGQLKYINQHMVDILATGAEDNLSSFFKWCLASDEASEGEYHIRKQISRFSQDFQIMNSIQTR